MRLGVTGRSRTGTSGFTAHGSSIELRPHRSARLSGLGGRSRTCGLVIPNHARCHLRHTELKKLVPAGGNDPPTCALSRRCSATELREIKLKLAPRRGFEPRTPWLTARRSASCAIGEMNWCLVTDSNGRPAG